MQFRSFIEAVLPLGIGRTYIRSPKSALVSGTYACNPQTLHLQLASLLLVFSFASVTSAAEKSVLFIHTDMSNGPAIVPYDKAFQAALTADTSEQIILYNEYTDLWRFGDDDYARTLNNFYRQKYAGQHFDLIVVDAPPALKFLVAHGDELFHGTPVVFCLIMEGQLIEGLSLKSNFTVTG